MESNYCEYRHEECEYIVICKNYDNMCARDLLGKEYFRTEGYLPKDILARIKKYKDRDKQDKINEYALCNKCNIKDCDDCKC